MKGSRLLAVARLTLIGSLLAGCSALGGGGNRTAGGTGGFTRPATVVTVARASLGPISETATYTGTVQASDTVNVVPQISGQIAKLNVGVGSVVKAGEVIAELDKSTLEDQVAQAQAGVDAARVKLAQIEAGGRPEAVAQAQANLDAAQARLNAILAGSRPETIAQAKANLDAAKAKLALIQAGPRPENVAEAKANLDAAQAKLQQLLDGPTPDQIAAATLQVQQAKDALTAVQANKDGQCNPRNPTYLCEAAQSQAMAAETAVNVAEQNLKTLTDPPSKDAVNQAKAAVDAAEQAYKLAQAPYTSSDLAQAQAAVETATEQYRLALAPYTSNDVAQARAAVDAARAALQLAKSPYTQYDVQAAQVALKQAQAVLAVAETNLKEADIVAPFDGVISAKLLSPGALASPQTPIVTLISTKPQVLFSIEESRIGNIKLGQSVNLTSGAFPGKRFPATVTSIYPSADPKTHSFTVVVEPLASADELRAGMFVNLELTVASSQNAVLVPNTAIVQQGPQSIVFLVAGGKAHLTPVTVGIANDQNSQITSGVKAGDEVVTSNQANLTDGAPVRVAGPTTAGPAGATSGAGARGRIGERPPAGATATPRPGG